MLPEWNLGMPAEIVGDCGSERLCEISQFLPANSRNSTELRRVCRTHARHLAQRHIGKNYVSRDITFVCQLAAHQTQALEEHFVAFNRAGAPSFSFVGNLD